MRPYVTVGIPHKGIPISLRKEGPITGTWGLFASEIRNVKQVQQDAAGCLRVSLKF